MKSPEARLERSDDKARRAGGHPTSERKSQGEPLTPAVLRAFQPSLGVLDDVRVHTSHEDAARARALDARAFTVGRDIHFGGGEYRPDTAAGRELLGHELVHSAQPHAAAASPNRQPAPSGEAAQRAARADHPAEREAERGPRRGASPKAEREPLHRFPRAAGLREGELIPPPLLMQVAGDRFLVSVDLTAARELAFVIQVQGDLPLSGEGLAGRTLRLTVLDTPRTLSCNLVELLESSFALDLFGDGSEIVRLVDEATPAISGDGRDHRFVVLRNGERARRAGTDVVSNVRVQLPPPPRNVRLGEAGVGGANRVVSALYDNYQDAFQISARLFGNTGLVAVHVQSALWAEPFGNHPTTLVRVAVAPEHLTLAYTRREGRTLEIDLNGDGRADLRFDHSVGEWTVPEHAPRGGYVIRQHRFEAFDALGQRLGDVNRHPIYHAPDYARDLEPIPAEARASPDNTDRGAQTPSDRPSLQGDVPGEAPIAVIRAGNVIDLRVDGDGDRRKELLLRFRPHEECLSDGSEPVTLEIIQISSGETREVELRLSSEQRSHLLPLVTRPADTRRPALVDVVHRFQGPVVARRFPIEIAPPRSNACEVVYELSVDGVPRELHFPPEVSSATPLVRSASSVGFAGMWVTDIVLGEYGDRFRLTFTQIGREDLLGLSAMDRDRPGETRAIALAPGTAAAEPERIECHPQRLSLLLGERWLHLVDALQAPIETDPLVERTHVITVFGTAVASERRVRFDYRSGSFNIWDNTGMETGLRGIRGVLPAAAEEQYDDMRAWGNMLAAAMRSASDRGALTEAAYECMRDLHPSMLNLRWESAQPTPTDRLPRLLDQTRGFLRTAIAESPPFHPPSFALPGIDTLLVSRQWDDAFEDYIAMLVAYDQRFNRGANSDTAQHEMAVAASGVDVMRGLLNEGDSLDAILLKLDASVASEVVSAHEVGIVSDELFRHWDVLRRAMPVLRGVAAREAAASECESDTESAPAAAAARGLQRALAAAVDSASGDRASFTGERPLPPPRNVCAIPAFEGGYGELLARAIESHDWHTAFSNYDRLITAIDSWVTNRLQARAAEAGADREEWQRRLETNRYVHQMRERVGALSSRPGVMPVAATFVPDTSYAGQRGYVPAVPLRLFIYFEDSEWHLRDLTNPARAPYECDADGTLEAGPPHALFEQLNDNDRFPKGILYYQVPNGGRGDRVRCTAEKEWFEWARDIGLGLAAVGFVLATFGTGTVAVAGAVFLAGSGVVNAVAAGGELVDSVQHGHASTTSIVINVLDVVASLAGAGALVSGTVVRSASQAARVGTAWTGAAARVAAFADRAYVPLTAVSAGGNVATAAVMTHDVLRQLQQLDDSGLSPEELRSARQALLIQLAITGGLTVMSVHGDLPEIMQGRRNIILDVVGDVAVARAAGVHIGGHELAIAATDARAHAAARWHGAELDVPPPAGVDAVAAADWRRRWLELPEPVVRRPDGSYEVIMPAGAPADVQAWLHSMAGPDSAVVRAARVFSVSDELAQLEAAGSGLRVDPLDPDWSTTRPQVVERLGGGAEAEAIVRRFERARLGALTHADEFAAQRRQLNQLVPPHEIERIQSLFTGFEIYTGGAAIIPGARLPASIDRVELTVAVPGNVSPDMMAAIEQRGGLLRIRPDPEYLRLNGLPADHTLRVEVRVVPAHGVAGLAAAGVGLHRIDSVLLTRAVDLDTALSAHLRALGVGAETVPYRVEVLSDEDFARRFGSERGRSVFQLENGQAVVYARPTATRLDMVDEAAHLAQSLDPTLERHIRMLSGANFEDWAHAPAQYRLELFQSKLSIEIDAKQRSLRMLEADPTLSPADIADVRGQLEQLQTLQAHVAGITPRELSLMNAGAVPLPRYLETPPWLFGKRTAISGVRVDRIALPSDVRRSAVGRTGAARSTAYNDASVREVRQLGSTWHERTQVVSGFDGTITRVAETPEGTVITVQRSSGSSQDYLVENGATLRVAVGDDVANGSVLADEAAREYRLVEIDYGGGRTDMREEILRLGPDGGFIQRGSESTFRGAVMEDAARRQVNAELRALQDASEIAGWARIPHSRGGGGFDDVIVEFTGTGASTQARVRIREVKDYPNRSVPLEEFTAIRGDGLRENLDILRSSVGDALEALDAGMRPSGVFGSMSREQLEALDHALNAGHAIRVEVVVGPTTRLGAEGHHAATVLPELRRDVQAALGYDALYVPEGGRPEAVLQTHVDDALGAATASPAP